MVTEELPGYLAWKLAMADRGSPPVESKGIKTFQLGSFLGKHEVREVGKRVTAWSPDQLARCPASWVKVVIYLLRRKGQEKRNRERK